MESMEPLLHWLRISLHTTNNNNTGPPATLLTLTAPFLDDDLISHWEPLLRQVLPGNHDVALGLETTIATMASAITSQTLENRTARIARDVEHEQPTTPSAKFGLLFNSLKSFLNVQEENELPDFGSSFPWPPKSKNSVSSRSTSSHTRAPIGPLCPSAPSQLPNCIQTFCPSSS